LTDNLNDDQGGGFSRQQTYFRKRRIMHYAFTMPVLPGQADTARQFTKELLGARKNEYDDLQRRGNIEEERYFLQHTPTGDLVIVTGTGPWALPGEYLKVDDNPFDRWFVEKVQQITGANMLELEADEPELMGEWKP
jgi:hypothetical protein